MKKQKINLYLASPRGFCAGVDRAVKIVEESIKRFGAPVYVRHEIVHNKDVVNSLARIGAIFVDEVSEAPTDRPIIFSAHGVAKSVMNEAKKRKMISIDATCPLVTKVHNETIRHYNLGRHILLIGHKNHVEVIGTMGQVPENSITLIETEDDAYNYISAISICNEGTIRDWVRHAKFNVTQGKNFEKSGSIGPFLIPFKNKKQLEDIEIETRVNDEVRQNDRTSRMLFNIPKQINYISTFTTLMPGDIIITGTPTKISLCPYSPFKKAEQGNNFL